MSRKIFLMRHADPENPTDLMYGNLPGFPLSKIGIKQAKEAGEFMSQYNLDVIITSGLERAHQTGEMVAKSNLGHPDLIKDPRLRDLGIDAWQGIMTKKEFMADRDGHWQRQLSDEEGIENPKDTQVRMIQSFEEYLNKYPDKNILFVSHADSIVFLFEYLLDMPLYPETVFDFGYPKKANIFEIELNSKNIKKIFEPTVI
ncbi:histidine phosphatase family protein [Patescibacteria group bacterium]|nr:histidine phosphatase family protein [Patescibacteria group bacterium]